MKEKERKGRNWKGGKRLKGKGNEREGKKLEGKGTEGEKLEGREEIETKKLWKKGRNYGKVMEEKRS